jgi:glyoxylase-like metal-dependent hydrolase (beta-lactamase superfamily II)
VVFLYGSELRDVQPEPLYAFARGAQRDLFAVKDWLTHVEIGDEIVSGLNVVSTRGHTPGHISLVQGGDGNLLKAGRSHPKRHRLLWQSEMAFRLHTEQKIALASRAALLDKASNEKLLMFGYHWIYAGAGFVEPRRRIHVRRDDRKMAPVFNWASPSSTRSRRNEECGHDLCLRRSLEARCRSLIDPTSVLYSL